MRTVVDRLREGGFADVTASFAPDLAAVVTEESLRLAWLTESRRIGDIVAVGEPVTEPRGDGLTRVSVAVRGEHDGLTVIMSVDDTGLLHGLRLAAAASGGWVRPAYVSRRRFTECAVRVAGRPGTLSRPWGPRRRPAVILLPGGGPFDRDASSGPAKPLKDLAWGLASRGVAVLRFDKPSGPTMTEEYVPPGTAAAGLLRRRRGIDPDRIFLLGHSMGGKAAPRVAAAAGHVAGLVLLAAEAQPTHRSAVRVTRHLTDDPEANAAIGRQAALIDGPELAPDTPADRLPLGFPASYWLDLRGYDPVGAAAALGRPMLILQGGRDHQVTVTDDLTLWRAGLANRPDVTISVHDGADHLFFPAGGDRHVGRPVIDEIAAWVKRRV